MNYRRLLVVACCAFVSTAAACGGDDSSGASGGGSGGSSVGGAAGQGQGGGGAGGGASQGGQAGQGGSAGQGGAAGQAGTAGQGGSNGAGGSGGIGRFNAKSPLGTNLSGISDWNTDLPFVDLFKTSRPWISGKKHGAWDDKRPLDLDVHGWVKSLLPDQIARTLVLWNKNGHYPQGKYHVLYDGKGTLEYHGGAKKDQAASSPGHDVLDVDTSSGGVEIDVVQVDKSDPIRNIRFIMPGGVCKDDPFASCQSDSDCSSTCDLFIDNYDKQVFHPQFLKTIRTYRALRFMDWMRTNGSDLTHWADRPKLDDARWRSHGVPVEVMVDLANRLSADAWFCMPHQADDDFVTRFASYVHTHLRKDLHAYVEYSNEVWNGMFAQAKYAEQQGLKQGLSSDPNEARWRYYSKRAVEVFKLWEKAYGGTAGLVRVLASQAANTHVADVVVHYQDAYKQADALAIAPYFGWIARPSDAGAIRSATLDDLMKRASDQDVPRALGYVAKNKKIADQAHLALIAYEGGQHYVGARGGENIDAINTKFDAMNRDKRMKDIYLKYLQGWKQAGGQVFMHFTNTSVWNKWGRWGSLEYVSQPRSEAPKYDALQTFIEQNDRWW